MNDLDIGKGNLLITYLFSSDEKSQNAIENLKKEEIMKRDLQKLVEKWKEQGLIKRYMIADDELINQKLTK